MTSMDYFNSFQDDTGIRELSLQEVDAVSGGHPAIIIGAVLLAGAAMYYIGRKSEACG